MNQWGSFSEDSLRSFSEGLENPVDYMVVAPALASRAAYSNPNMFFGDDLEEEEGGYDDEDEAWGSDWEDEEDEVEVEPNARMAMSELRAMASDIMQILSQITPEDNLEPWVAAKITMSKQNLSSVSDYLSFRD